MLQLHSSTLLLHPKRRYGAAFFDHADVGAHSVFVAVLGVVPDSSFRERLAYHEYEPFGMEMTLPYQDDEAKKFTGHERDFHADPGTSFDASFAYYGGAAAEAGLYVNPRNQNGRFDLGLLGDVGFATGWSAGAGFTLGWLFADSSKLDGPFGEANFMVTPLTVTFMFDHDSGDLSGITFGPSAGAGAVFTGRAGTHISFTEGFRTAVMGTYQSIMNRYTTPFFPMAH
ncbi:MAG: hypothetical protein DRJ65_19745 [Acidobacteria bacterium]|nr:MAG: hypothetical protein DRJ65_19745 [Acidobacteriota bacterium]